MAMVVRSDSEASRLWRLMQRIENCRHRAEMAERRAQGGTPEFRGELQEIARHWRDLAHEIEAMERLSDASAARHTPPTD